MNASIIIDGTVSHIHGIKVFELNDFDLKGFSEIRLTDVFLGYFYTVTPVDDRFVVKREIMGKEMIVGTISQSKVTKSTWNLYDSDVIDALAFVLL